MVSDAGVAEHLSRRSRQRLVELIYRKIRKRILDERAARKEAGERLGRGRPDIMSRVASELGVDRKTLFNWLHGEVQACNINAQNLVRRAWGLDEDETSRILRQDLESHARRLDRFLKEGVVSFPRKGGETEGV